ncbi:MAG: hypothetical protein RIB71_20300, partial [Imperialibacter sp.]|uniref:hypothetical protein n=1 Tax=Imperialibacter sp. TaxID=2038411 RepID=UPI0032ED66A2
LGGLITPPEQRYRYFNLLTKQSVSSQLQHISIFQSTETSRHKQSSQRICASPFAPLRLCVKQNLASASIRMELHHHPVLCHSVLIPFLDLNVGVGTAK